MKHFNSIEERRAYYAEAAKRFRERRKQQEIAYYDPEAERTINVREQALSMKERGVPPLMIWAALDVKWEELAPILQVNTTIGEQQLFFA